MGKALSILRFLVGFDSMDVMGSMLRFLPCDFSSELTGRWALHVCLEPSERRTGSWEAEDLANRKTRRMAVNALLFKDPVLPSSVLEGLEPINVLDVVLLNALEFAAKGVDGGMQHIFSWSSKCG